MPSEAQNNASCVGFSEAQRGVVILSSAEHPPHPRAVVVSTLLGPKRAGWGFQHGDRVRFSTGEPVQDGQKLLQGGEASEGRDTVGE